MHTSRRTLCRIAGFLRPSRAERDLAREVDAHLALIEEDYRRRGLSPDEARLAARRAFGGVEQAKERQRDARSFIWLEQLRQDVRHACRSFARTPGFALVVILTLAVGIGANTAIFSVIHSVLLKSLPYPEADRIVRLVEQVPVSETRTGKPVARSYFTFPEFDALARHARTLSAIGTYNGAVLTMVGPKGAVRLEGTAATPSVFEMLGAQPILGRTFTAEDVAAGRDHLVVLSDKLWQTAFDGDPHVLGKSIGLQHLLGRALPPESYTVIGVMPPGFHFLNPDAQAQLWLPLARDAAFIVARLAPGVSSRAAGAEVDSILSGVRGGSGVAARSSKAAPRFELVSARDELVAPIRPALVVLALAAVFVLLIACVNVANLVLARTTGRRREIAVRIALGAGRGRVIRHLLTESVMLALAGGLAGIAVALGALRLLRDLATTLSRFDLVEYLPFPRLNEIALDGSALAFTALVALASGILFGLMAAIRSSAPVTTIVLRQGRASSESGVGSLRRLRGRGALVVAQTSLAVMLLTGGGLLIRSFARLAAVDPGYDPGRTLTFQVALSGYSDVQLERFVENLLPRIRRLSGIEAAGASRDLPMVNLKENQRIGTSPYTGNSHSPIPPGESADTRLVSSGYFPALGMKMIAGRALTEDDGPGHPRAVVINEALARRDFPGQNPVGRSVYVANIPSPWTIVGVVADVREFALDRETEPGVFIDARWIGDFGFPPYPVGPYFIVRVMGDPAAVMSGLRGAVRTVDPQGTVFNVAGMDALIANSLSRPRLYAVWLGIFAGIAVLLAAIGIYGVLAYAVEARTREIGIRRALGAQTGDVLGLVLKHSLLVTALGLAIGLAGAAMLTRYLAALLYGLTPLDPGTFAAAALTLSAVALLASYVPARRATRVEPQIALRAE